MDIKDDEFQAEIVKQVTYWQQVLALQDWNVEVRLCRQWEMSDQFTLAETEWYLARKDAIIRVLHPKDLGGLAHRFINDEESDYDITIVHELLHLHFAPFDKGNSDGVSHEQAINAISRGMVKLYRTPTVKPVDITEQVGHYF